MMHRDPETRAALHPFAPGTLRERLRRRAQEALAAGALAPIETDRTSIEDSGVRFLVRVVSSLARKPRSGAVAGAAANPFLPYDRALFVADVSDTHLCLLNKYNVLEEHLLIVTRRFEDQEALLTRQDFEALWMCMAEYEALGFYNGGREAGASQSHKHLQMVPLPLAPDGPAVPIEPLLPQIGGRGIVIVPHLPFLNAFARLDPNAGTDPKRVAVATHALYRTMLDATGLRPVESSGVLRQGAPYNLLLTRRWMWLVPRTREHFEDISINALGFAGSFFVHRPEQVERLRRAGPMRALSAVAMPRDA